jgi:hypothetical protein
MENETQIVNMRFHTQGPDQLYIPIPFLFVTERMRDEILAEREFVLTVAPEATKQRQLELLATYNPRVSADAFQSVLQLFEGDVRR